LAAMKWLKVFAAFFLLHAMAWIGAHIYQSQRPATVLVVADTSFALKPQFVEMQSWLDDYAGSVRYRQVLVGTDKAMIGQLADIRSRESIFRTAFGRSDADDLRKYDSIEAEERILLSDGSFSPPGWTVVTFP